MVDKDLNQYAKSRAEEFGAMEEWTPEQTYQVAKGIVNSDLSEDIASGNERFLEQAVGYFEAHREAIESGEKSFENYADGIKRHLGKALPHQFGHVAARKKGEGGEGVGTYQRVAEQIRNFDDLSAEEKMEVAQEVTDDENLSSVPGQESNMRTLGLMTDKYKRLKDGKGEKEAKNYAEEKSGSVGNILTKSFLPNLEGWLARQREEKK